MVPANVESAILRNWKLKLAILSAVVLPTVSVSGAYYKLQIQLTESRQQTESRISKVELDVARNFADKQTMERLRDDVSQVKNDVTEIKTLLRNKVR